MQLMTAEDVSEALLPPAQLRAVSGWETLRALMTKELKVKYKRSFLGVLWSLVTPLFLTVVYLFVFNHVFRVAQRDFPLFLLTGLLPWQLFNLGLLSATNSLVENGALIRKVYFPRSLIPAASIGANFISFAISMAVLGVVLVASGRPIWRLLHWVVIGAGLEVLLLWGLGLTLSVLNVYFRDVRQLLNILMVALFFGTPIVYEQARVPVRFRTLVLANPLSGIMETYRSALYHAHSPDVGLLLLAAAETALLAGAGVLVFRHEAPKLAKEI